MANCVVIPLMTVTVKQECDGSEFVADISIIRWKISV